MDAAIASEDAAAPEQAASPTPASSAAPARDEATPARESEDAAAPASPAPVPTADDAWPADCERREKFVAHGISSRTDRTKYRLEPETQQLTTFIFALPWGEDLVQLLEARPIVDNERVLHHWALYTGTLPDFLAGSVLVQPPAAPMATPAEDPSNPQFVVGGGPGTGPVRLPPDVGMRVPSGRNVVFMLEIHYYNPSSDAVELDASGVELCVTSTPRPIEAAIHHLGTQSINLPPHAKTEVTAVCNPAPLTEPVHMIAVSPHMHLTAVHSKLTVQRASGEELVVFDEPYAFKEQRIYALPRDGSAPHILIESGDRLTTTCSYDNQTDRPITYGVETQDEMCAMFLWVWPADRLHNADPEVGTFLDSPNVDCTTR